MKTQDKDVEGINHFLSHPMFRRYARIELIVIDKKEPSEDLIDEKIKGYFVEMESFVNPISGHAGDKTNDVLIQEIKSFFETWDEDTIKTASKDELENFKIHARSLWDDFKNRNQGCCDYIKSHISKQLEKLEKIVKSN